MVFLDITMSGFCGRRSGVVVVFLHGTFCGELRCYSMTYLYMYMYCIEGKIRLLIEDRTLRANCTLCKNNQNFCIKTELITSGPKTTYTPLHLLEL